MLLPRLSLRTHLSVLVISMGLLGLGLALLTGEYYRGLIHQHQRKSLERIATVKAEDTLRELETSAREFAISLLHSLQVQDTAPASDNRRLTILLEREVHRRFGDAPQGAIEGIALLDGTLQPVTTLFDVNPYAKPLCPGVLSRLETRSSGDGVRYFSVLCTAPGRVHLTTVVPVGETPPRAYLAIVMDPVFALSEMGRNLDLALSFRVGTTVLYSSSQWSKMNTDPTLVAQTTIPSEGGEPLTLEIADPATQLASELRSARLTVMFLGGIATLIITFIALKIFSRCTLKPLRRLAERMRLVRNDRSFLGTQIKPVGNAEMRELAEDFNDLSSELRELNETLESLAYNDHLTGLPNRVLFRDRIEQQMRLVDRERGGFAVLAIDLDRFKQINDTLGHHAGDLLLQQVAQRMKRTLRKSDTVAVAGNTVARVGGDEFCVLLPAVREPAGAATVAEKLIGSLDEEFNVEGNVLKVGMSIGIALYPKDALDLEGLSRAADRAMYIAKRRGGGYCAFGSPESDISRVLRAAQD